jgi:DNA-binding NtrC family response regulator
MIDASREIAVTKSIVGQDPALLTVVARAARVAPTHIPVLISGESGTGKELLAELIHRLGPAPGGPFVAVNCGTLPRELADSELFGHERGAFTGAARQKVGWFGEADRGTLVLDEIGELPLDLQPKLLRVLETGRLRRVGGTGEVSVRVRIVAMTLRDLRHEVACGRFRNDLYHRLAGFELPLPPLRRRRADIPLLLAHFLAELTSELGSRAVDHEAAQELLDYDWPGNVRELRNVLRRAAVLCPERITAAALELPGKFERVQERPPTRFADGARLADADLPIAAPVSSGCGHPQWPPGDGHPNDLLSLSGQTFDQIERAVFQWALDRNRGSRRQTARALGLPRSTFCDKVKRFGLG